MRGILIRTLIIAILIGGAVIAFLLLGHYSEGERVGTLVKFSHKGNVFKTWEGQLNTGVTGADATMPTSSAWEFSVVDDAIVKQMQEMEGRKIKVHYVEKYYVFFWQGDTKYFAQSVEATTP
jgi:hypothetical protein